MDRNKKSRVTIEIFDENGMLCESVGGPMSHEEVKDQMIEILRNDGIPVIRKHGKHEKVEEKPVDMPVAMNALLKGIDAWGETGKHKLESMPMVLEYEFDGIKFHAEGHPLDVHYANESLMKRVFEEKD